MKPPFPVDPRQVALPWDAPLPVTRQDPPMTEYLEREAQARDETLERLRARREALVAMGRLVARKIATEKGTVTAGEVLATLRADARYAADVAKFDPRWAGCLFRGKEWEHVGEDRLGSHRRTVWLWRLR